jgi:hypothetical protein
MYAWNKALNEGDARTFDSLYMPDSRDRNEYRPLLQRSPHLKSLIYHLPMYPKDFTILKQDNTAVILFDKILLVRNDASFQGSYIRLFLEKSNDRWFIVEDVPPPAPILASRTRHAKEAKEARDVSFAQAQPAASKPQPPRGIVPPPPQQQDASKTQQVQPPSPPDRAIHQLVEKWASSWQSGDMKEYRSCYAPDFKNKGMNLNKYIEYKTDLSRKYRNISVRVSNVKISAPGSQSATVTFTQKYSASGGLKTSGTKKLELKKVKDAWKIYRETMSR